MKILIAALTLFSSASVFAWGNTGHRVVGEIATRFLDEKIALKVHEILKGQSLARVSTWPDDIKSEPATYQHTFNWHYTTWHTDDHDHSEHEESSSTGFLLKSISEQTSVLRDPDASMEAKAFALKFIVHLVGDVHMPLHVGNGTDQGGNYCKVTFHGKTVNLHALWDEEMINFTNLSFTELTKFITEDITVPLMNEARSGSVVDWALESKKILATLYPENVIPSSDPVSIKTYCERNVQPAAMPKLGYEYSYRFMPVIEKRLLFAGVRLADLLNNNLK